MLDRACQATPRRNGLTWGSQAACAITKDITSWAKLNIDGHRGKTLLGTCSGQILTSSKDFDHPKGHVIYALGNRDLCIIWSRLPSACSAKCWTSNGKFWNSKASLLWASYLFTEESDSHRPGNLTSKVLLSLCSRSWDGPEWRSWYSTAELFCIPRFLKVSFQCWFSMA